MRWKLILGVVLMVCGAVLFLCSDYITEQVAIGRGQIYRGQQTVNTANTVIDQTTRTPGLGGLVTGGAQEKINEGKAKANYYENLASNLKMGGIGCFVIGALLFLFGWSSKRKWFNRGG